jgi:hypothetical protein
MALDFVGDGPCRMSFANYALTSEIRSNLGLADGSRQAAGDDEATMQHTLRCALLQ